MKFCLKAIKKTIQPRGFGLFSNGGENKVQVELKLDNFEVKLNFKIKYL